MFKYNTTSFTNVSDELFYAKYDGVEFLVELKETRYWPTALSRHAANQLADKIISSKPQDSKNVEGVAIHSPEFRQALIAKILGPMETTATPDTPMSFAEEVKAHEEAYAEMQKAQRKEDVEAKAEALKDAPEEDGGK